ncbi:putative mobilization protein (MobS-like) (plasmid) [Moraxella bovoculi 237]|uniref:Putative mobilization protein (MobS-like) n=1 Tax=Moraxella bovoculi 237 TaxID=743974 RepID=A0A066UEI0_9GAMM|nr:putative mobilization protein (MobS-like) [Moraxella bovoculi 237]
MAKSIDDKIADFESKLKQLKEQKKLAENREKKKAKEQERKDETRRKILIGSMYLQRMKNDEQYNQNILQALDRYLTENRDRKLFGLSELPVEPKQVQQEQSKDQDYFGSFNGSIG